MKGAASVFILVFVIIWSLPSWASPSGKFRDGLKRVMTSPFQVSDNVRTEGANAKFLPFGLTGGLLKGCFYMVKQMVGGTLDMVTSPVESMHK